MTLPSTDTLVSYAAGALSSEGTVQHIQELPDGRLAVLLDATACHPVDAGWPDQGADRAVLRVNGAELLVLDCVVGATDGSELFLGADIPVRKGTDGWAFVAAHLVAAGSPVAEGDSVLVEVDAAYRHSLSAGHTGCHLASLALNRQLAGAWKKEVAADAAGNPDFDALAIESSTILENGSLDVYRLGKSLRRKGFAPDALLEDLAAVQDGINATLAAWTAAGAAVRIERDGDLLTDRRYWTCELPEGTVRIPCGGTHLGSLGEVSAVTVALEPEEADGAVVVRMRTTCTPAAGH
ncbi:metal-dependent hydrolase [Paenarthrobacter sp. DKR-5]|uniref:metal-dependent hydrolase n=1 Tax=Paenarthrobacter sp. DKR-5 TaxID=2835535 RepID=UPI001BDBBA7A|nr:metal-dependent hydrolase [Paenarthrobacter sp. DKR-5]MBT1002838.1 metal-dependent hydrolase [Paenarthrobacter sp. DKR-5]